MTDSIDIQGAREHNLKNVNVVARGESVCTQFREGIVAFANLARICVAPWPGLGLAPFQQSITS